MTAPPPKKLTAIPKIPPAFGEDDGVFYKYYDDLADELDNDMVTSLKSQLDGILIFAGLFAGVNSAFLAFTLPQMSPDPTDDTNALLFQIMLGGNSTIKSPADLPSASFSPTASTYSINVLFSMSLTLALLGSFLAVLGQQWLVYYRKRSGGGAEYQRWEQLRRYLGAKRWRLELVLDDVLPSLLQVALVIFCVAFILYLGTLSRSLCYTIAAPLCAAGAIIVMTAMCAAWDHWCPFKSPLSHLIQPILKHSVNIIGRIVGVGWSYAIITIKWLVYRFRHGDAAPLKSWMWAIPNRAHDITEWIKNRGQRPADAVDQLKVIALRRVLCTSEDSNAIVHAATNTQSISQTELLGQILNDEELRGRLDALYTISYDSVGYTGNAAAHLTIQGTAISRALLHMILMAGSAEDFLHYNDQLLLRDGANDPGYSSELMKKLDWRFPLYLGMRPVDNECAECSHCVALGYCMRLFEMILEPQRLTLIRFEPKHLEQHIRVTGASKEVGLAWIEAWLVKILKEWDQLSGGEEELTPDSELHNWQIQKVREFLHLYQNIDVPKFLQTILEAIQTSTDQWSDQPATEVYVGLFEQDLRVRANMAYYKYCLAVTINSLVTLLRSIEHRIRDTTASDERESQRKHRKTCTENWITYINNTYHLDENDDSTREAGIFLYGPLWYHCVEASATLKPYLQWMADIIRADPGNADNLSMIKMVIFLFGCLKDPDESMREIERVESSTTSLDRKMDKGKIEEYRQLYPFFAKTVRELESAVAAAVPHSPEVEKHETQAGYENLWSQDESCDISLGWY